MSSSTKAPLIGMLGVAFLAVLAFSVIPVDNDNEILSVAKKGGCLNCHDVNTKLVGPAWMDVSKAYQGEDTIIATLADGRVIEGSPQKVLVEKIKIGGGGHWATETNGKEMPANGYKLSEDEASDLIHFILGLSK